MPWFVLWLGRRVVAVAGTLHALVVAERRSIDVGFASVPRRLDVSNGAPAEEAAAAATRATDGRGWCSSRDAATGGPGPDAPPRRRRGAARPRPTAPPQVRAARPLGRLGLPLALDDAARLAARGRRGLRRPQRRRGRLPRRERRGDESRGGDLERRMEHHSEGLPLSRWNALRVGAPPLPARELHDRPRWTRQRTIIDGLCTLGPLTATQVKSNGRRARGYDPRRDAPARARGARVRPTARRGVRRVTGRHASLRVCISGRQGLS